MGIGDFLSNSNTALLLEHIKTEQFQQGFYIVMKYMCLCEAYTVEPF